MGFYCFRNWYLIPMEGYYKKHTPSPPFHYEMVSDMNQYAMNLYGAPRGFAKSYVIGADACLYLLYTIPHFDIAQCLSVQRMIPKTSSRVMSQIEQNPYLLADFGPMKSTGRGGESWSKFYFQLKNGSSMEFFSTEGRKRGARPDLFVLDDPEFDTDKEETSTALIESFQTILFKQIIPMLRKGSRLFWIGTVISRRTNIYLAQSGEDKRFAGWNIKILPACKIDDKDNFTDLLWPEEWGAKDLKKRREDIGEANFASEYLNSPTSEQARLLEYDYIRNTYQLSDDLLDTDFPLAVEENRGTIKYSLLNEQTGQYESVKESYRKWLHSLFRVILVDFAYTMAVTSDFHVVATVGFCRKDIMWLLELWVGKTIPSVLHTEIIKQGVKWQAHQVAPESPPVQYRLVQEAAESIQEAANATKWYPKVIPPTYPKDTPKAVRIAQALEWRFARGRIKLPSGDGFNTQQYRMMLAQINDFTMDLALLTHDDIIDALAMGGYIKRKSGVPQKIVPTKDSYQDMLAKGHTTIPGTNISLLYATGVNNLTDATLHGMKEHSIRRLSEPNRRRRRRNRVF